MRYGVPWNGAEGTPPLERPRDACILTHVSRVLTDLYPCVHIHSHNSIHVYTYYTHSARKHKCEHTHVHTCTGASMMTGVAAGVDEVPWPSERGPESRWASGDQAAQVLERGDCLLPRWETEPFRSTNTGPGPIFLHLGWGDSEQRCQVSKGAEANR